MGCQRESAPAGSGVAIAESKDRRTVTLAGAEAGKPRAKASRATAAVVAAENASIETSDEAAAAETVIVGPAGTLAKWGDELIEHGDFDGAIGNYDKALQIDDGNPSLRRRAAAAYAGRARTWVLDDDRRSAQRDYETALRLDPARAGETTAAFAEAFLADGQRKYARWQHDPKDTGLLTDAHEAFARAAQLNPTSMAAFKMSGYCQFALGNLSEALAQFSVVINTKPDDPAAAEVYRVRGTIYLTSFLKSRVTAALPLALADFDRAVQLEPNRAANYCSLANALAAAREGQRAVDAAKRACELSGYKDWNALFALASACYVAGNSQHAVKWVARALELAPANEHQSLHRAREAYQKSQPLAPPPPVAAN